jgi:uncharacterized BrkB/YihY/UPF0761 family membrane protein
MRGRFDDPRFYRGEQQGYQKSRRPGRVLLYLFFFILGSIATIGLTFVISPALLQAFLELSISALYAAIVAILIHPAILMFSVTLIMIFVIFWLLRQRGRWR